MPVTYTLEEIKAAWYDYWIKQEIRKSYINSTFENFKQHLTQGE
jgi:hypothetical protein